MNIRHCISKVYESLNCLLFLINFDKSENYKNHNIKSVKFHNETYYYKFNLFLTFSRYTRIIYSNITRKQWKIVLI